MVIRVFASLTVTNQTNLEKTSTQTSMAVLSALLLGSLPTQSMKMFFIGLCATSEANDPQWEFVPVY